MTIVVDPDVIPLTQPDDEEEQYDPEEHEYPDTQPYPTPDWKP